MLWELDGQVLTMVNLDGSDEAFFLIHPVFQNEVYILEIFDLEI